MYQNHSNLFLTQSYETAWQEYDYVLNSERAIRWDWIVITASNEKQAQACREQIEYRLENQYLPSGSKYVVVSDPDGKRVGSGGATLNVLKYIAEHTEGEPFEGKRILVIHSGGDSKRIPQYSACGKLFAPVPRMLPNGIRSTLFDEFMIMFAGVAPRMNEGMLVISGDIVLLFNPLQVDLKNKGAAALSIKEPVEIGVDHGVFQSSDNVLVNNFLHKQSEEVLRKEGAVNERNCVDLDTGTIWFDSDILHRLYALIAPGGVVEQELFDKFINEKIRLSFYGDFLYPMADSATFEEYLKEEAEGEYCDELLDCRKEIWDSLYDKKLNLVRMSPARYIHFGTTRELLELTNKAEEEYTYLSWKRQILGNRKDITDVAYNNSYISRKAKIGSGCYFEDTYIGNNVTVGNETILSNVVVENVDIPAKVVLHRIKTKDNKYITRIYGLMDNPKSGLDGQFLGATLRDFVNHAKVTEDEIWDREDKSLWTAKIYPICDTAQESVKLALIVYRITCGCADNTEISVWKSMKKTTLMDSFNNADTFHIIKWQSELENEIRVARFISRVKNRNNVYTAMEELSKDNMRLERQAAILLQEASRAEDELKERIFLALAYLVKKYKLRKTGYTSMQLEDMCYSTINKNVKEKTLECFPISNATRFAKEDVLVELPVRVNWCGGPSDAPPYCLEMGGAVINTAIKLRGEYPVKVVARRLEKKCIHFESSDLNYSRDFYSIDEIRDCCVKTDSYSLHKACILATGIVPLNGDFSLEEIFGKLGGGIFLSTSVDVPMGSGLGTSSILAAACVKALNELMGQKITDEKIYAQTLCAEQLMDTGGGWQDQVGGVTDGIKLITSRPGIPQQIMVQKLQLDEKVKLELQERFVLIYSGQRRLAKNILRQEMNRYLMYEEFALNMIHEVQQLAVMLKYELEKGNIDNMAKLLNRQWELLKGLDKGSSNMCIEQIFEICDDLIVGKSVCGVGGGGFMQVILKKGVKKEELSKRLERVFQDCGVAVWDCELV